ncbi:MAG: lipase, partial [Nocardia sp.]|uniref:esterase/lipase family protein n=1 Tax=Nocardia sp. TaxID=1821 RepID=UPI0026047A69
MVRISGTALAAAVATAVLTGMAATPGTATAGPVDPAGTCRPTADHPYPVVLLHGTMDDSSAWNVLSPSLTAAGYCVFAPSYGRDSSPLPYGGIAPIARAADEVATYIDGVLAQTGATRVDIVGHSQGGTIAEYYAKNLGQARHVHTELLLAPG